MKSKIFTLLLLLFIGLSTSSAQVGIGTSTPDASSILDLTASGTSSTLLLPRLTNAQRDAGIKSPSVGLIIFNTTTKSLEVVVPGGLWSDVQRGITSPVAIGTPAQNTAKAALGTTNPDPNSVFDITSINKGVLLPRLTADPTDAVEGMLYYNTLVKDVKLYDGTSWIVVTN